MKFESKYHNKVSPASWRSFCSSLNVLTSWWRHQMETFSALLVLCAENSPVTGEFPTQRPVTRSFDVFFDLCLINGWVNNRETGDLRRHRAHYDVTVMMKLLTKSCQARWRKDYLTHRSRVAHIYMYIYIYILPAKNIKQLFWSFFIF